MNKDRSVTVRIKSEVYQELVNLAIERSVKENRVVNYRTTPANPATGVNGEFTDSAAHLVTASLKYKF